MSDLAHDYLSDHKPRARRSYNAISPKMAARRAEREAVSSGRAKVYSFKCWYCKKIFKTTNPYLRYCCPTHRTLHQNQDNIEEYDRGHYARHNAIGGGAKDGDGFQ